MISRSAVPCQPINIVILTTSMTFRQHERCRNLPNRQGIRHSGQNNCCCVWIPWSSHNTTLYTTGLFYEHKQGVVKFSNVSGTFTTDTVQKGWLNRSWLTTENGKVPFLLMLLANADCGWHGAEQHNRLRVISSTRSVVVEFSNLCRTFTTDILQKWWLII